MALADLNTLTLNDAYRIAGGSLMQGAKAGLGLYNSPLSAPGKMPCYGYSVPAYACNVGTRLRDVDESICSGCYAFGRGRYVMPGTIAAMDRRLASLTDPLWVEAMVTIIAREERLGRPWFRWHDSGDVQDAEHLRKIVEVADRLPGVRFWIPTRELRLWREFQAAGGIIPPNLTVRYSMPMIGMTPSAKGLASGSKYSTAHYEVVPEGAVMCPATAPESDGECGSCRNCWDQSVDLISYRMH